MNLVQIIFICDHHEIADSRNSEIITDPVALGYSAGYHHAQFEGQRVTFNSAGNHPQFGKMMVKIDASTLTEDDDESTDKIRVLENGDVYASV